MVTITFLHGDNDNESNTYFNITHTSMSKSENNKIPYNNIHLSYAVLKQGAQQPWHGQGVP